MKTLAKRHDGAASSEASLRELRETLTAAGFFDRSPQTYWLRAAWVLPTLAGGHAVLLAEPSFLVRFVALIAMAFASVQGAAVAHEAGHGAVTSSRSVRDWVGSFFMTFLVGSCFPFWLHKHGQHHLHSNSPDDPDLSSDILCFSAEEARSRRGVARWIARWQHVLIWPAVTLIGFTLKIQSWIFLLRRPRAWLDKAFLVLHFLVFIGVPALLIGPVAAVIHYLILTWLFGCNLAFIFLPNHVGRPWIQEPKEATWLHRQVATARNLTDSWLATRIFNGLNHHIEHHLFPNVPFSRLSLGRRIIKDFCQRRDLPYHEIGVWKAFGEVYTFNREIARIARQGG